MEFILLIRDFPVFGRWSSLTPGGFTWTPCGVYVNSMWIPCNNLAGLPAKKIVPGLQWSPPGIGGAR